MSLLLFMKVGIVGYRFYNNYAEFCKHIKSLNIKIDHIVSGKCSGADTMAEQYAKEFNIPITIYAPEWGKYGKKAGLVRNTTIVNDSEYLIAFLSKKSVGTYDSIAKARDKGIPVKIFQID